MSKKNDSCVGLSYIRYLCLLLYCFTALLLYCFTTAEGRLGVINLLEHHVLATLVSFSLQDKGVSRSVGGVNTRYNQLFHVNIRHHTSAYVSIRQSRIRQPCIRQHTSAYVSIRQHTCMFNCYRCVVPENSAYMFLVLWLFMVTDGDTKVPTPRVLVRYFLTAHGFCIPVKKGHPSRHPPGHPDNRDTSTRPPDPQNSETWDIHPVTRSKSTELRNFNIDDATIASRAHTHPSHSQTPRLLFTSLKKLPYRQIVDVVFPDKLELIWTISCGMCPPKTDASRIYE